MENLRLHIEKLLIEHDFVNVPSLGGFVSQQKGADIQNDTLIPSHKVIGFNPQLSYNDGLLAQSYVKEEKVSFAQANSIIISEVNEIRAYLDIWKRKDFSPLGSFYLSAEDTILFEPSKKHTSTNDAFGFTSFFFPALNASNIEPTNKTQSKPTGFKKLPVSSPKTVEFTPSTKNKEKKKSSIFKFYATACAMAIFLLLFFPVSINDKSLTQEALFIPTTTTLAIPLEMLEQEDEEICEPYHLIISSFRTQARALRFLKNAPKELDCRIIYSENRFRIAVHSFEKELECDNFLTQFIAQHPKYRDAWVLYYN